MRIDDPLRIAGGARSIAEEGAAVLIERGPVDLARKVRDTPIIILGGEHDEMFDRIEQRLQALDDRGEIAVEQQDAASGVIDRIGDMLVGKAGVGGVQDIAHSRHREEQLEVTMIVPRERTDPVAGREAKARKPLRARCCTARRAGIVVAKQLSVAIFRDDLPIAVRRGREAQYLRHVQRDVLHQAWGHLRHRFLK